MKVYIPKDNPIGPIFVACISKNRIFHFRRGPKYRSSKIFICVPIVYFNIGLGNFIKQK